MRRFFLIGLSGLVGIFLVSGIMVSNVLAQDASTTPQTADPKTECTSKGHNWCMPTSGSGWCNGTTMCPANDEPSCLAQNGKWCKSSVSSGWCSSDKNYVCPINTEADCKAQGKEWCTSGSNGWCANVGSCSTNQTQTQTEEQKCLAQGSNYKWCRGSEGGYFCQNINNGSCPAYDDASCVGKYGNNYKWCKSQNGVSTCQYSNNGSCPAYDETSCVAQKGEWCPYQSGTGGWCSATPGNCPIYSKEVCISKGKQWCQPIPGTSDNPWCAESCPSTTEDEKTKCVNNKGKWCLNQDQKTGWCSYSSSGCPAYTEADCKAQNGEWCAYTSGTGGWCTSSGGCPINDQKACVAKGRKWCNTAGSAYGWCASAGQSCPASTEVECKAQNGEWCPSTTDGSRGWCATSGGCPINDQTACTAKGRKWCKSTSGGYGWCASEGQICPGGTEVECKAQGGEWCNLSGSGTPWCNTKLGSCPLYDKGMCEKAGRKWCAPSGAGSYSWCATLNQDCQGQKIDPTPTTPDPDYLICPDNSRVPKGGVCTETYYICPNGQKVKAESECRGEKTGEKKDEMKMCLEAGNTWCSAGDGASAGFCSTPGFTCEASLCLKKNGTWCHGTKGIIDGRCVLSGTTCTDPPIGGDDQSLTEREKKDLERQKKSLLRELKDMDRTLQRFKKTSKVERIKNFSQVVEQVVAFTAKVEKVKLVTASAHKTMSLLWEEMEDLRDVYRDIIETSNDINEEDLDEQARARALKNLKDGVHSFEAHLNTIEIKVRVLERQKIAIDPELKAVLAKAKDFVKRTKAAKSYDEISDIVDQMPVIAEALNDFVPKLQQLAQLRQARVFLEKQSAEAGRLVRDAKAAVKRFKLSLPEEVEKLDSLLAEIKAVLAEVKNGTVDSDNLFKYLGDNILEKVDEIRELNVHIAALGKVQSFINSTAAAHRRYQQAITKRFRAGEDTSTAEALLSEAEAHLATLRTLAKKKLTSETGELIIDELRSLTTLGEQLEDELGLTTPDQLERQLRQLFDRGGKEFKPFEVKSLEQAYVESYRMATLYRRPVLFKSFALDF